MGLSGSGINEENHIVNGSWIAWLIDDSIGAILSVPFCPYHFVPYYFVLEPPGGLARVLTVPINQQPFPNNTSASHSSFSTISAYLTTEA